MGVSPWRMAVHLHNHLIIGQTKSRNSKNLFSLQLNTKNMNKLRLLIHKTALKSVCKALTLCGVAVTFAACYGTPPIEHTPDYWAQKNAEETLLGTSSNVETPVENPAGQASQNEPSALLPDE